MPAAGNVLDLKGHVYFLTEWDYSYRAVRIYISNKKLTFLLKYTFLTNQ